MDRRPPKSCIRIIILPDVAFLSTYRRPYANCYVVAVCRRHFKLCTSVNNLQHWPEAGSFQISPHSLSLAAPTRRLCNFVMCNNVYKCVMLFYSIINRRRVSMQQYPRVPRLPWPPTFVLTIAQLQTLYHHRHLMLSLQCPLLQGRDRFTRDMC